MSTVNEQLDRTISLSKQDIRSSSSECAPSREGCHGLSAHSPHPKQQSNHWFLSPSVQQCTENKHAGSHGKSKASSNVWRWAWSVCVHARRCGSLKDYALEYIEPPPLTYGFCERENRFWRAWLLIGKKKWPHPHGCMSGRNWTLDCNL